MTYLSDSSSQEQESRAQEVRLILERTFALAQASSNLGKTEDGLWQYVGSEHTLIYNPDSDSLWIAANHGSWQLGYHEQAFLSGSSSQITDGQLEEFRELSLTDDKAPLSYKGQTFERIERTKNREPVTAPPKIYVLIILPNNAAGASE